MQSQFGRWLGWLEQFQANARVSAVRSQEANKETWRVRYCNNFFFTRLEKYLLIYINQKSSIELVQSKSKKLGSKTESDDFNGQGELEITKNIYFNLEDAMAASKNRSKVKRKPKKKSK
jgi:hypothetical protein